MTNKRWTSVATRSSRHGLHAQNKERAGGLSDAPLKQEKKLTKDAEKELLKEAELLASNSC